MYGCRGIGGRYHIDANERADLRPNRESGYREFALTTKLSW